MIRYTNIPPCIKHRHDIRFNVACNYCVSQLAFRVNEARRMNDRFPGRQKLTIVVTHSPRSTDNLTSTIDSWRRQSSDNWRTLLDTFGTHTQPTRVDRLFVLRFVDRRRDRDTADRKYEFIADHVTTMTVRIMYRL